VAAAGITPLLLDLDDHSSPLPDAFDCHQIFYFAPPPRDGLVDVRLRGLLDRLRSFPQRRLVYIGTTGVYGDCAGDWVDETRPLAPQAERAKRRADAEQALMQWRDSGGAEVIRLRVAGIYGPGRLPEARLRKGTPMVAEAQAPYTNRIHIHDLARVCLAAMARGRDGEAYNVSDGNPGTMTDYFNRVAELLGLPRPPSVPLDAGAEVLGAGMLSYLQESRRLDNRKMLADLAIELRYPTLAEGLASIAAEMEKP
jgi:nucleoside-diphosphate-sugar epimerase